VTRREKGLNYRGREQRSWEGVVGILNSLLKCRAKGETASEGFREIDGNCGPKKNRLSGA